jgi:hypothetical protein
MANQCDLRGQLPLKSTRGLTDVRFVMANFLQTFELDFDMCVHQGHISIEQDEEGFQLYFCLENLWGTGGLVNQPIDELCSQLGPLTERPGHLLFIDQETGNSSAVETPYFVGADAAAIAEARLAYGFQLFAQWTGGTLGPVELQCLNRLAMAMHKANQRDPTCTAEFTSNLLMQAQRAFNDMEVVQSHEFQTNTLPASCKAQH